MIVFTGCDPFGLDNIGQVSGTPLERDLARALRTDGRVECTPYAGNLWECRVESDPGSGFSGSVYLRLGPDGCWRARHVRYEKDRKPQAARSDLSKGNMHPFGREVSGCSDIQQ